MKTYLRTSLTGVAVTAAATALVAGIVGVAHADPVVDPSATPIADAPTIAPADPTPAPSPTYAPGMAPNEHAGWAIVDPNTGQVTGGVIVCTPEVCGSGWFAGMRVVLQTLQDPVEAAHSSNGVGNVAGYNGGTYSFTTGQWTFSGQGGSTWQIPLAYPGADQGGTVNVPVCIANCPTPEPTETPISDPSATPSDSATPEPSTSIDPSGVIAVTARTRGYAVTLAPLHRSTGVTTVIARQYGKVIKTWTLRPGTKKISFVLPRSYKGVQLTVSRKGAKSTRVLLV